VWGCGVSRSGAGGALHVIPFVACRHGIPCRGLVHWRTGSVAGEANKQVQRLACWQQGWHLDGQPAAVTSAAWAPALHPAPTQLPRLRCMGGRRGLFVFSGATLLTLALA